MNDLLSVLARETFPCAVVDVDAFDRNVARHVEITLRAKKPLRVATKSIRVTSLLRRVLDHATDTADRKSTGICGLMCFSAFEAAFLAKEGFDDLFVAYPTLQPAALDALAKITASNRKASIAIDSREGVDALADAGARASVKMDAVLCLDTSVNVLGLKVGVKRSPLRSPEDVVALATYARSRGVNVCGVMAYEAVVAGVADAKPHETLQNTAKRALKTRARAVVAEQRKDVVKALTAAEFEITIVNGGGTGSLDSTSEDESVTEVTGGSGFFKPHLFDDYASAFVKSLEPAAFFALEATRRPTRGVVTCAGGGYVASGEIGKDRAPIPWLPRGLLLTSLEGAGEAQTPLEGAIADSVALGSPVIFRHAKAGELMERFGHVLLVRDGKIVERAPTYRGQGQSFL